MAGGWRYLWPGLLVVVGLFVPLFILWAAREHRTSPPQVLADPQQRQHFVLSGLVLTGGLAEMMERAEVLSSLLRFVWPIVLVVVGYLFMAHAQHGTSEAVAKAVRAHRILGGTLILAGLALVIAILSGVREGVVGVGWIVLLFAAAVQFLMYREPEGAYASGETHGHGEH